MPIGFLLCWIGLVGRCIPKGHVYLWHQCVFLLGGIVWCRGSSLDHCPASSAGGPLRKWLLRRNPFLLPPGLRLFLRSTSWLSARFSTFHATPLRHPPTFAHTGWALSQYRANRILGFLGVCGERKDPAGLSASLTSLSQWVAHSPPTRFPAKLGRVNIYQPPWQWGGLGERTSDWSSSRSP